MKNNHGFSNILIISIALVLLGVGGYFGYSYLSKPNNTNRIQNDSASRMVFYFDLDTKQVTNIDVNKQYFGEELNGKRKELGRT